MNPDYNCGLVTAGTVEMATASGVSACSGTPDNDVWYSFVAANTNHRISLINLAGGSSDMMIGVYRGSCGSLVNVGCSDPETYNISGLTVGETYFVQVYTYFSGSTTTTFNICIGTLPPVPANDLCANAIMVGANSVTPGTTSGGTTTGNPGTCTTALNTAPGVWYTVEGINGMMTASLCGAPFDTKIGIFTGSCGNLACVQGNDDDTGINGATACGGTFVTQSSTSWLGLVGTTYYIYVTAYQTNSGPFNLTLSSVPGTSVVVAINTDSNPAQLTWEITNASNVVVASGSPVIANGLDQRVVLVSATPVVGCYGFRLMDSFGDGINGGNWQLRSTSGKVLLRDDFANGSRSPSATPANASYTQHGFCLPPGNSNIAAKSCGIMNSTMNNLVYASIVPGATSYQFEFSNPDAGFIRRIAVPNGQVRYNQMVTSPLTPGVKYFARVRTNAAGTIADAHFGGGCELGMTSTIPCTQLISAHLRALLQRDTKLQYQQQLHLCIACSGCHGIPVPHHHPG